MDSERNQGRSPEQWTGSTTTGSASTTGSLTWPVRSGWHNSNASTRCSPAASAWRRSTARTLGELEGVTLPCENSGQVRRGWFVYVIQLPHGVDRDSVVTALGTHGVAAKTVLPGDH